MCERVNAQPVRETARTCGHEGLSAGRVFRKPSETHSSSPEADSFPALCPLLAAGGAEGVDHHPRSSVKVHAREQRKT